MNTTKITAANLNGCIGSESIYIPYTFPTFEKKKMVLRLADNEDNCFCSLEKENYTHFLSELEFALNVAAMNGWDSVEKHLNRNGYNFRIVGIMPVEDFLENTKKDIIEELNIENYK